ncbi:MAG: hypothetical protein IJ867_06675 [Clostridia bacterium]|nr:hypothetical protein [Clostridia bacterium]
MEKRVVPEFLVRRIKEEYSENEAELILAGLKQEKKSSFRVNRINANCQEIEAVLREKQIVFEKVDFLEDAFVIEKSDEEVLRGLSIYQDGKIYMQSLSSMMPVLVLEPREKENILDMCAAPRWEDGSDSQFD